MNTNESIKRVLPGDRMSKVVVHNSTAYFSGLVPDDLAADFEAQMLDVLHKIDSLLAELGSDKTKLLSAVIYLPDIGNFSRMNALWDNWVVPGQAPARATVGAKLAKEEYLIEIMIVAAV
jgi:enamine deaminase RidA (YjgF/YER057c/UK114 family)